MVARSGTAPAPHARAGRIAFSAVVLLLSWGTGLPGALLTVGSTGGSEALGLVSAAIAFGGVSALLPLRGGHGGRGGPLFPLTLGVAGCGAGLSALATGLGAAGVGGGLWLDLLAAAWMPGCLTVVSVFGAAVLLRSRSLLAGGALTATALAATSVAELGLQRDLPVDIALWGVWLTLTSASSAIVVWRAVRGPLVDRDAAVWLAVAQGALLALTPGVFLLASGGAEDGRGIAFAGLILPAAVCFASAAFLLTAIARAPSALDPALARVAVWVLLLSALLVAYGAVTAAAAQVAPLTPTSGGMIAVVLLVVCAEPARRGVRRGVDRLLYGRSADPRTLLRTLGEEIAAGGESGTLDALAEALRRSLRLGGVALRSATPGGPAAIAGAIDPSSAQLVPLLAADGTAGSVEVSAAGWRRVDAHTITVLRRIGGLLSIAVRLAEINDDLVDARRRARRIASSERRFARAEIEAGIEPALGRIRAALREAADSDDPATTLSRAGAALHAATVEVRDLARTLLPGSLDAGDLPGALAELAERFDAPVLGVSVTRVPERPEGVYHLVAEAVLRARRRGGIDRIDVAVRSPERWELTLVGERAAVAQIRAALLDRAEEAGLRSMPGDATLVLEQLPAGVR